MALTIKTGGFTAAILASSLLAACNSATAPSQQASDTASNPAVSAGGTVRREPMAAEQAPVTPMAPQVVIQSQPGPAGSQVDLLKVAVTGDILTVTLRCSGTETFNSKAFGLKDISVIDDATSQRIGVLKDGDGNWLASKVAGNAIMTDCAIKPGVFWAKFAAPSAGAKTVSINLPEVAPFDGVPVTRPAT